MQTAELIEIPEEKQIVQTVGALCAAAADMIIMSREDLSEATDVVAVIKSRGKEIELERTKLVKPFNEGVKQINVRFKKMSEPLDAAEQSLKAKMLAFQQDEARKMETIRREAERQAAEEAERRAAENKGPPEDVVVSPPLILPASPPKTTYGQYGATSSIKKTWTYQVVDIQALATARPDLVIEESSKINAEIRGKGGLIPGLRIFEKETIAIR